MIRRLVNWLLYKLHIKRRVEESAIKSLSDLFSMLLTVMAMVCVWTEMAKFLPKLPWYTRAWYRAKDKARYVRAVVVGY